MLRYFGKRILYIIPTFFALTILIFAVLSWTPGDPVLTILGQTATEEEIVAKRHELGLDQPMPVRYVQYIGDLFQGDMGDSWITGNDIFAEFITRLPNTCKLALYAIILTVCIGIPLGVIAAIYQNSVIDRATLIVALIFISLPAFFVALIAQIIFAMNLGILPASGADSFKNFIMPSFILSASQIATQVRMTRSSMLDVIQQDYIRTARAKGCNKIRLIVKHALRNGLLPVVTGIGNSVARCVSGAAIIEMIFAIPGLGSMMIDAVRSKDVPRVMGPIIFIAVAVCVINMLVDICYAFIDPRIKLQYKKNRGGKKVKS